MADAMRYRCNGPTGSSRRLLYVYTLIAARDPLFTTRWETHGELKLGPSQEIVVRLKNRVKRGRETVTFLGVADRKRKKKGAWIQEKNKEEARGNSLVLHNHNTGENATQSGKMVFIIQLLLISPACASEFVVNVANSFYEAEENHNVTLEWTFTAQPSSSNKTLFIYCEHLTQNSLSVIFHIFQGVEASLYQDKRFVGRVQSDKDALRNGRIRLHLSNVTTEDSGVYKCQVNTEYGWGSDSFQLNVTEAAHEAQTQGPAVRSPPNSEGNFFLYVVIGVVALGVVILVIIGVIARCIYKRSKSSPKSVNEKNCQQPLRQQSEPSDPQLKA